MSINFYTVDINYLNELKKIEKKVPNTEYATNKKFFCGVVLTINGYNYFAPISSFKKKQQTNIAIYNNNDEIISTIRFCFMIPIKKEHLRIKDISKITDTKYQKLLSRELQFCNQNEDIIKKAAHRVYNYGTNPNHKQYKNCCDFKKLEEYLNNK